MFGKKKKGNKGKIKCDSNESGKCESFEQKVDLPETDGKSNEDKISDNGEFEKYLGSGNEESVDQIGIKSTLENSSGLVGEVISEIQSNGTEKSTEKLSEDEPKLENQVNNLEETVDERNTKSTLDSNEGTEKSVGDVISEIQSDSESSAEKKSNTDSKPESQVDDDPNANVSLDESDANSENKNNKQELSEKADSATEAKDGTYSTVVENPQSSNEEEGTTDYNANERKEFTFDEMIDIAGYGRFQRCLTFLAGLGWMADAFEIRILSILGNFLSCDWDMYRWQNAVLTSIVFIGMIFGAPCFGIIADKFGRRKSLAISLLFLSFFGAISAVSRNMETLLTIRWVTGFVFGGATQGFTLCSEYYPARTRGIAGFYLRYYWVAGTILLILLTWLIMDTTGNWHYLVVAAASPSLLVFFSMNWFPESVRWYQVSGRYEKAVHQMATLLSMNGTRELEASQLKKISEAEVQGSILDLLKSPHKRTTLLIWYISFAASFHYYGISLMSPYVIKKGHLMVPDNEQFLPVINVTSAKGFFLSKMPCTFLTAAHYTELIWHTSAEFPGLLVFTTIVRYVDRRTLLSTSCLINGFMVLILLAEARYRIPTMVVLYITRAICCGILQLVLIMTTEAFPTTLRATGVGSGSAFSKLGAAIVPFVAQVLVIEDPISGVCILGVIILLGAAAGAYLPRDMRDAHLMELTQEQNENNEEEDNQLV